MLIPGPAVPGGEKVLVDTMKFLIRIYLLQFTFKPDQFFSRRSSFPVISILGIFNFFS
jgi:hypothetical protein